MELVNFASMLGLDQLTSRRRFKFFGLADDRDNSSPSSFGKLFPDKEDTNFMRNLEREKHETFTNISLTLAKPNSNYFMV